MDPRFQVPRLVTDGSHKRVQKCGTERCLGRVVWGENLVDLPGGEDTTIDVTTHDGLGMRRKGPFYEIRK